MTNKIMLICLGFMWLAIAVFLHEYGTIGYWATMTIGNVAFLVSIGTSND